MTSEFSFLVWFVPALLSSSALGGVLVQLMIHRTRRHVIQNIADLAEAAVKLGDKTVINQIAQVVGNEVTTLEPKQVNWRRRHEISLIILPIIITLAVGSVVGVMFYIDEELKYGGMKSAQADVILNVTMIAFTIIMIATIGNLIYQGHKKQKNDKTETPFDITSVKDS